MACKPDSEGACLRPLEGLLLHHLKLAVWLEGVTTCGNDAGGGCTIFVFQNEPNVTVTVQRSSEGITGQGGK